MRPNLASRIRFAAPSACRYDGAWLRRPDNANAVYTHEPWCGEAATGVCGLFGRGYFGRVASQARAASTALAVGGAAGATLSLLDRALVLWKTAITRATHA